MVDRLSVEMPVGDEDPAELAARIVMVITLAPTRTSVIRMVMAS